MGVIRRLLPSIGNVKGNNGARCSIVIQCFRDGLPIGGDSKRGGRPVSWIVPGKLARGIKSVVGEDF